MTACAFTLDHYRELLDAATAGGYRLAAFDHAPEPGDLFLRHDVDLSLVAAVRLAEVEADAGVWATWCLMTRSAFYNLDSKEGDWAIGRLRALGGRIGHHAVRPHVDLDERFEPVVGWHNPNLDYVADAIPGATNPMSPPWYDTRLFRSDANHHWGHRGRAGECPHAALAAGELEWLQLVIHPEIWVYEGTTMRETMESFLDADRASRLEHLRDDRIDLT
jgi:hypothetical protein